MTLNPWSARPGTSHTVQAGVKAHTIIIDDIERNNVNPKPRPTRNEEERTAAEIVRRLTAWICYLQTRSGGKVSPKHANIAQRRLAAEARPYILRAAALSRAAVGPCRPLHWTPTTPGTLA